MIHLKKILLSIAFIINSFVAHSFPQESIANLVYEADTTMVNVCFKNLFITLADNHDLKNDLTAIKIKIDSLNRLKTTHLQKLTALMLQSINITLLSLFPVDYKKITISTKSLLSREKLKNIINRLEKSIKEIKNTRYNRSEDSKKINALESMLETAKNIIL